MVRARRVQRQRMGGVLLRSWEAGVDRDPKFAKVLSRKANEKRADELVEGWTSDFSAEEVMHRMQAAGVGAGVVQSGKNFTGRPSAKTPSATSGI